MSDKITTNQELDRAAFALGADGFVHAPAVDAGAVDVNDVASAVYRRIWELAEARGMGDDYGHQVALLDGMLDPDQALNKLHRRAGEELTITELAIVASVLQVPVASLFAGVNS